MQGRDAGDRDHTAMQSHATARNFLGVTILSLFGAVVSTAICLLFGLGLGLSIGTGLAIALSIGFIGTVALVEWDDGEIERRSRAPGPGGDG